MTRLLSGSAKHWVRRSNSEATASEAPAGASVAVATDCGSAGSVASLRKLIESGAASSLVGTALTVISILAPAPSGRTLTEIESSSRSWPEPSAVKAPLIGSTASPSRVSNGFSAATSSATCCLTVLSVTVSGLVAMAPARLAEVAVGRQPRDDDGRQRRTLTLPPVALAVVL